MGTAKFHLSEALIAVPAGGPPARTPARIAGGCLSGPLTPGPSYTTAPPSPFFLFVAPPSRHDVPIAVRLAPPCSRSRTDPLPAHTPLPHPLKQHITAAHRANREIYAHDAQRFCMPPLPADAHMRGRLQAASRGFRSLWHHPRPLTPAMPRLTSRAPTGSVPRSPCEQHPSVPPPPPTSHPPRTARTLEGHDGKHWWRLTGLGAHPCPEAGTLATRPPPSFFPTRPVLADHPLCRRSRPRRRR